MEGIIVFFLILINAPLPTYIFLVLFVLLCGVISVLKKALQWNVN